MKAARTLLGMLAAALALAQPAKSADPPNPSTLVVLPGGQATNFGNVSVAYPWNLDSATGATSLRYQQVYGASDFGGVSGTITQLGFRVASAASNGTAFNPVTLSNVTIILSTTTAAPDGLNSTFAGNTGPDAVTVFQGSLTLSSSAVLPPETGAAPLFDARVYLQTPFNYNPTNGNLLMDLAINTDLTGGAATSYFDAQNTEGDSVSRVWATDSGATKATTVDSKGIITQFLFGSTTPPRKTGFSWLLGSSNYRDINDANSNLAAANFNNSQTYIFNSYNPGNGGVPGTAVPGGWSAIGGIDFKAVYDLETAISNGWIGFASASSNLEFLLYDNESWTNTPSNEQTNAAVCESLFANLAHALGYSFIATPALDIMNVQPENCSGPNWQQYIDCNIPTTTFPVFTATSPADIYEIQSQTQIEGIDTNNYDASTFNQLVSGASSQAFAANSNIVVFTGINVETTEETNVASIAQMYESVINPASSGVFGFWFNTTGATGAYSAQVLQFLDTPPVILAQPGPAATDLPAGGSVTWTTLATGPGPIAFQWYEGGVTNPVPGATNASFTLSNATASASYFCGASNAFGPTNSSSVAVNVTGLSAPRYAGGGAVTLNSDGAGQLNFSGTAGTTYRVWGSTNLLLRPVTGTWTLLGSGIFSGDIDSFAIHATNTCMFYVITQP